MTFSLSRSQEDGLNRHWGLGKPGFLGTLVHSGISGCYDNFHGKTMFRALADGTASNFSATGVDFTVATGDTASYKVWGASQILGIRTNAAYAVTGVGFPQAAGTTDKGVLRLTLADQNGVGGAALTQDNLLWIPNAVSFRAGYYIDQITNMALAKAISFTEIGLLGSQATIADITNAAKEPADGNPFIAVKIASGRGALRVRTAASATILESESFEVPSTGFNLQFEYNYVSTGSVVSVFINGTRVGTVKATVTGPLQRFARVCHGASYVAATHTPTVFDIGESFVSLPTAG
jgi:hypothetical protein